MPTMPEAHRLALVDLHTLEIVYTGLLVACVALAGAFSVYVVYKLFKGQD